MLQVYVSPYHVCCHFIPNQSYIAPLPPQYPSSQLLPQYRMLEEQSLGRNTLDSLYCLTGAAFRRGQQKQGDVVRHHLKRVNLQPVALCSALEDLLQALSHRTLQNQFTVLRSPNQVVLEVVHHVLGTLDRVHFAYTNSIIQLRRISAFLPQQAGGYLGEALYEYEPTL